VLWLFIMSIIPTLRPSYERGIDFLNLSFFYPFEL
jgi:hypothetical protein